MSYYKRYEDDFYAAQAMRNKLGQLEDIEDELGIDLITLFKAVKSGVYYKVISEDSPNYGCIFFDEFVMVGKNKDDYGHWGLLASLSQLFYFKDYGKTWALTKEELE